MLVLILKSGYTVCVTSLGNVRDVVSMYTAYNAVICSRTLTFRTIMIPS